MKLLFSNHSLVPPEEIIVWSDECTYETNINIIIIETFYLICSCSLTRETTNESRQLQTVTD